VIRARSRGRPTSFRSFAECLHRPLACFSKATNIPSPREIHVTNVSTGRHTNRVFIVRQEARPPCFPKREWLSFAPVSYRAPASQLKRAAARGPASNYVATSVALSGPFTRDSHEHVPPVRGPRAFAVLLSGAVGARADGSTEPLEEIVITSRAQKLYRVCNPLVFADRSEVES
jgi:hypothetical protein